MSTMAQACSTALRMLFGSAGSAARHRYQVFQLVAESAPHQCCAAEGASGSPARKCPSNSPSSARLMLHRRRPISWGRCSMIRSLSPLIVCTAPHSWANVVGTDQHNWQIGPRTAEHGLVFGRLNASACSTKGSRMPVLSEWFRVGIKENLRFTIWRHVIAITPPVQVALQGLQFQPAIR